MIQTAPTVTYEIQLTDGTTQRIDKPPSELPNLTHVEQIREPYIVMNLILPNDCVGNLMQMCEDRRGVYKKTEYLGATRVMLQYELPLAEVIYDFYDRLKSSTKGYGTMDYDVIGFRPGELVKVDVLVNGDRVDALSTIVHRDHAEKRGRTLLVRLKEEIPKHLFEIPLQAAIGGKVIARETIKSHGQERDGQVLRRRREPQAEAAGEAEGGEEANEAGRQRRHPAGGVHGDFGERGLNGGETDPRGVHRDWPADLEPIPRSEPHGMADEGCGGSERGLGTAAPRRPRSRDADQPSHQAGRRAWTWTTCPSPFTTR